MTEREAIKLIKSNQPTSRYIMVNYLKLNEALKMAINALNKQIARKPDCIEDKMWCCPVCNNHLLLKWVEYPNKLMPKTAGLPHCMSCGQKIDWSE